MRKLMNFYNHTGPCQCSKAPHDTWGHKCGTTCPVYAETGWLVPRLTHDGLFLAPYEDWNSPQDAVWDISE